MVTLPPATYEFGNLVAQYTPSKKEIRLGVLLGIVFLLTGFGVLFLLVRAPPMNPFALLVVLAAWVVAGFYFWLVYRNCRLNVQVFQEGLLYMCGNAAQTFRWDEMESVTQKIIRINGSRTQAYYWYTLRKANGEHIKLTNAINDIERLGTLVQRECFRYLMPRALETYNNGGTLQFGELKVNKDGLSNKRETLLWSQIKAVHVQSGYVGVQKKGAWVHWNALPVARIPNIFIFTTLVDQIIGIKSR